MQDLLILHSNQIYPHDNKDDFKAYKHLHGIDMKIHSIPKPPSQKAQDMELSDLHHEEFKIFEMEHNTPQNKPHNELYHFVNTLQQQSVIGQLNYLAQNSRPDISFAVHQCARFSKEPMALHEKAVKRIIYYLQCTRDKPLNMKPNKNLSLDTYCDSDFAGVWHQEFAHPCDSCLSRTGFIIVLAGAPIQWLSKLKPEISLSSTEAE
jgi:hypothetical protein